MRDLAGDEIAPGTHIAFRPRVFVTAVNCNGPAFTASDGVEYLTDTYFTGGSTSSTPDAIAGTVDDTLYRTERSGAFTYQVPVANGRYYVTLKLAEISFTAVGQRIFTLNVEGVPAFTNLDLFALAGHDAAYDVTVAATVTDGSLTISGSAVVDNPKLSAFAIYAAPEPYTDFASWRTFHFGATPGVGSDAGDDPEEDGANNWFEYVFGGDPGANDGVIHGPKLEIDDPLKLTISYRKSAPGATYAAQWTSALLPSTWSGTGLEPELYHAPSGRFRRSVPILADETQKFLRLEISGN